jgi:hypothetical protein
MGEVAPNQSTIFRVVVHGSIRVGLTRRFDD